MVNVFESTINTQTINIGSVITTDSDKSTHLIGNKNHVTITNGGNYRLFILSISGEIIENSFIYEEDTAGNPPDFSSTNDILKVAQLPYIVEPNQTIYLSFDLELSKLDKVNLPSFIHIETNEIDYVKHIVRVEGKVTKPGVLKAPDVNFDDYILPSFWMQGGQTSFPISKISYDSEDTTLVVLKSEWIFLEALMSSAGETSDRAIILSSKFNDGYYKILEIEPTTKQSGYTKEWSIWDSSGRLSVEPPKYGDFYSTNIILKGTCPLEEVDKGEFAIAKYYNTGNSVLDQGQHISGTIRGSIQSLLNDDIIGADQKTENYYDVFKDFLGVGLLTSSFTYNEDEIKQVLSSRYPSSIDDDHKKVKWFKFTIDSSISPQIQTQVEAFPTNNLIGWCPGIEVGNYIYTKLMGGISIDVILYTMTDGTSVTVYGGSFDENISSFSANEVGNIVVDYKEVDLINTGVEDVLITGVVGNGIIGEDDIFYLDGMESSGLLSAEDDAYKTIGSSETSPNKFQAKTIALTLPNIVSSMKADIKLDWTYTTLGISDEANQKITTIGNNPPQIDIFHRALYSIKNTSNYSILNENWDGIKLSEFDELNGNISFTSKSLNNKIRRRVRLINTGGQDLTIYDIQIPNFQTNKPYEERDVHIADREDRDAGKRDVNTFMLPNREFKPFLLKPFNTLISEIENQSKGLEEKLFQDVEFVVYGNKKDDKSFSRDKTLKFNLAIYSNSNSSPEGRSTRKIGGYDLYHLIMRFKESAIGGGSEKVGVSFGAAEESTSMQPPQGEKPKLEVNIIDVILVDDSQNPVIRIDFEAVEEFTNDNTYTVSFWKDGTLITSIPNIGLIDISGNKNLKNLSTTISNIGSGQNRFNIGDFSSLHQNYGIDIKIQIHTPDNKTTEKYQYNELALTQETDKLIDLRNENLSKKYPDPKIKLLNSNTNGYKNFTWFVFLNKTKKVPGTQYDWSLSLSQPDHIYYLLINPEGIANNDSYKEAAYSELGVTTLTDEEKFQLLKKWMFLNNIQEDANVQSTLNGNYSKDLFESVAPYELKDDFKSTGDSPIELPTLYVDAPIVLGGEDNPNYDFESLEDYENTSTILKMVFPETGLWTVHLTSTTGAIVKRDSINIKVTDKIFLPEISPNLLDFGVMKEKSTKTKDIEIINFENRRKEYIVELIDTFQDGLSNVDESTKVTLTTDDINGGYLEFQLPAYEGTIQLIEGVLYVTDIYNTAQAQYRGEPSMEFPVISTMGLKLDEQGKALGLDDLEAEDLVFSAAQEDIDNSPLHYTHELTHKLHGLTTGDQIYIYEFRDEEIIGGYWEINTSIPNVDWEFNLSAEGEEGVYEQEQPRFYDSATRFRIDKKVENGDTALKNTKGYFSEKIISKQVIGVEVKTPDVKNLSHGSKTNVASILIGEKLTFNIISYEEYPSHDERNNLVIVEIDNSDEYLEPGDYVKIINSHNSFYDNKYFIDSVRDFKFENDIFVSDIAPTTKIILPFQGEIDPLLNRAKGTLIFVKTTVAPIPVMYEYGIDNSSLYLAEPAKLLSLFTEQEKLDIERQKNILRSFRKKINIF